MIKLKQETPFSLLFSFVVVVVVVVFAMQWAVAHLHFGSVKDFIWTLHSYRLFHSLILAVCRSFLLLQEKQDFVANLMCGCGRQILDKT